MNYESKKIIFLFVFAFALTTGIECYSQTEDNLTLRDEDLPYDSYTPSESSNSNGYTVNPAYVEQQSNKNIYTAKVLWVNLPLQEIYEYDIHAEQPNIVIVYYSNDGYCFTHYTHVRPIIYDDWQSWRLLRYSSYNSFCSIYPFFRPMVNRFCMNLDFGYRGNSYFINPRDNSDQRRYADGNYYSYRHYNNRGYDPRVENGMGYSYSQSPRYNSKGNYQFSGNSTRYSSGVHGGGSRSNESRSNGSGYTYSHR